MNATDYLVAEWKALSNRTHVTGSSALALDILVRYSESHRAFHTPEHLRDVVALLEDLHADDRLILAAWFHDAIYIPGRPDNEARSADLARSSLRSLGFPASAIDFVGEAVLATASHSSMRSEFDPLLDADLSILGAASQAYQAYREAIRQEYQALPEAAFNAGRKAFIHALLQRHAIFQTAPCRERFEAAARRNLKEELDRLESVGR